MVLAWGVGLIGLVLLGVGVRAALASAHEREAGHLLGQIPAFMEALVPSEGDAALRALRAGPS